MAKITVEQLEKILDLDTLAQMADKINEITQSVAPEPKQRTFDDVLEWAASQSQFRPVLLQVASDKAERFINAFAKKVQICEFLNSFREKGEKVFVFDLIGHRYTYDSLCKLSEPILYDDTDAPELIRLMGNQWPDSFTGGGL